MTAQTLKTQIFNNIYPEILPSGFKERRQILHLTKNRLNYITPNQLPTD
jgi:hypothetical protein